MFYRSESGITNKSVSGDRGAYFLSRRAHLLTTDKVGGVLPAAVVRSTRLQVNLKGDNRLSPYTILKQKSSQEVRDVLRWQPPHI